MTRQHRVTIAYVFKTIVWPRRKLLFVGLILITVNRLTGFVLPSVSTYLLDEVLSNRNIKLLKVLLAVAAAAISVQAISSVVLTNLLSVEAQRVISILRARVQRHILMLPMKFFDDNNSGSLVARVMTDVEGVRNIIGTGVVQLVGGAISIVISFFFLVSISPLLTGCILVPIAIFWAISLKTFAFIRPIYQERSRVNAEVTSRLAETFKGVRVIKGFNAESHEIKTFERGVEQIFQNVKRSLMSVSLVTGSSVFLLQLATVGIMGLGAYLIVDNQLTVGQLIAFALYLGFIITPISQMSSIGTQLTESFAGLDRTEELLNLKTEYENEKGTTPIGTIKGDVVFDNVTFEYEPGKPILDMVSFRAEAGTITALVGSSGSGKTTIAGLVASFYKPVRGSITIDQLDLSSITPGSYRNQLGVVLQDDFLFDGTIRENILFSNRNASSIELTNAIKAARVSEFSERFQHGLDTVIGERGVKLSGGQRQRIAIARAILADPRILILDEVTSNLDSESENLIKESMTELMKGRTTFVIAHRLSTIRMAHQILVIEQGAVAEKGTHEELIELRGRYFELYTYQCKI
ncbi:ABC transporter ATP-binding protein [Chryseolinea lacunae]|uniref:ABC transporter ATP-binding protein n=1 Tax=Chryseolinea lacunae TaxID=2801331 RepID=A0ABS1KPA0_9BACT|nr:ABC transporter ATP-binding protein [Chryseolinea lacunae]MBL0741057.1 ABC transporter ATP-binding protein [Chryseolinea lacunae]